MLRSANFRAVLSKARKPSRKQDFDAEWPFKGIAPYADCIAIMTWNKKYVRRGETDVRQTERSHETSHETGRRSWLECWRTVRCHCEQLLVAAAVRPSPSTADIIIVVIKHITRSVSIKASTAWDFSPDLGISGIFQAILGFFIGAGNFKKYL